ncbi:MAG TPA: hypothetical protein VFZ53_22405 [Polyangiaceae bacterium]
MDDRRELESLERLAERLGIEVRSRVLKGAPGTGSGLCRVRGKWLVIINSHSTLHEKRSALAEAIATVRGGEEPQPARPQAARPGLVGLGPKGRRRAP